MDPDQVSKVEKHMKSIVEAIGPIVDVAVDSLRSGSLLNKLQCEEIHNQRSADAKALKLLDFLKTIDDGWHGLTYVLIDVARSSHVYDEILTYETVAEAIKHRSNSSSMAQIGNTSSTESCVLEISDGSISPFTSISVDTLSAGNFGEGKQATSNTTQSMSGSRQTLLSSRETITDSENHCSLEDLLALLYADQVPAGRVAILSGDAGIGKTAAVKDLCSEWAERSDDVTVAMRFKLVLALPLRDVVPCRNPKDLLEATLQYYKLLFPRWFPSLNDHLDTVLAYCKGIAEDILFIADGYDEYTGDNKDLDMLTTKVRFNPNNISAVIVTTRPHTLTKLTRQRYHLRLERFSHEHVLEFVTKNSSNHPTWLEQLKLSGHLAELSKVPLLLHIICNHWKYKRDLLSSVRLLFDDIVRCLVKRKESGPSDPNFNKEDTNKHLVRAGKVAYEHLMAKTGGNLVISAASFSSCLTSLDFLRSIGLVNSEPGEPGGLTSSRNSGDYTFVHKLFQQYTAALFVEDAAQQRPIKSVWKSVKAVRNYLVSHNRPVKGHAYDNDPEMFCTLAQIELANTIHLCDRIDNRHPRKGNINQITICNLNDESADKTRALFGRRAVSEDCKVMMKMSAEATEPISYTDVQSVQNELSNLPNYQQFDHFLFISPRKPGVSVSTHSNMTPPHIISPEEAFVPQPQRDDITNLLRGSTEPTVSSIESITPSHKYVRLPCSPSNNPADNSHDISDDHNDYPPNPTNYIDDANRGARMVPVLPSPRSNRRVPNVEKETLTKPSKHRPPRPPRPHGKVCNDRVRKLHKPNVSIFVENKSQFPFHRYSEMLDNWRTMAKRIELSDVTLTCDDAIQIISMASMSTIRQLTLKRNGLTRSDYDVICSRSGTEFIQGNRRSGLELTIQPDQPSDITERCLVRLARVMVHLSGFSTTFCGFSCVNNFGVSRTAILRVFAVIFDGHDRKFYQVDATSIRIKLNECSLRDDDVEAIVGSMSRRMPIHLVLQLNDFSKKGRKLLRKQIKSKMASGSAVQF